MKQVLRMAPSLSVWPTILALADPFRGDQSAVILHSVIILRLKGQLLSDAVSKQIITVLVGIFAK